MDEVKGLAKSDGLSASVVGLDFELEEGEELMGRFGAGIVSYFLFVKEGIYFMLLASLVCIPIMLSYAKYNED